ncbi:MAG: ABC transporter permease [Pseudomonadota bacterium]|nr:ABC transporter permease [Pseudomonadota bacterium]
MKLRPMLELRGASRRHGDFDSGVQALQATDLTLHAGTLVAITGPSGSGKSTLLNLLGLLDTPSAGSYRVAGHHTDNLDAEALALLRREYFGFVFQRYQLLPHLSALENVELPASYAGVDAQQRRRQALAMLERVGLAHRARHRPAALSGGEQQRVALARALVNGAPVLLADEPTGALDRAAGRALMDLLLELQMAGRTIVVVTHDPAVAAYAERVIEMQDGRIVADRSQRRSAHLAPAGAIRSARPVRRRRVQRTLRERVLELARMALPALAGHPLRTALTMLGVIIGTASVVGIDAIGAGAQEHIRQTVGALAGRQIEVRRGHDWGDPKAASVHTLAQPDFDLLSGLDYLDAVSPLTETAVRLRRGRFDEAATVNSVGTDFLRARGIGLADGRNLMPLDVEGAERVALIDQASRRRLFEIWEEPVGATLLVGKVPFVIVGVTDARTQDQFSSRGLNVVVPYTTGAAVLSGRPWFDTIVARLRPGVGNRLAETAITRQLLISHGSQDFFTHNLDTVAETVARTTQTTSLMLSLIGAIALLVGGIGVMNIMLVSVVERTREIGVRLAVGGHPGDILAQFLSEAILVCTLGGGAGVVLAFGMAPLLSHFVQDWNMSFTLAAVLKALLVAVLTGLAFGWLPAWRASRLPPVQALAAL